MKTLGSDRGRIERPHGVGIEDAQPVDFHAFAGCQTPITILASCSSSGDGFQAEIRYALDCARQLPPDEIFIVPVRLDGCPVPRSIQRRTSMRTCSPIGAPEFAG
jgi:hypothetical protein